MAKRTNKCATCKYFVEENCQHPSNQGILIEHRRESIFYDKTPLQLNRTGACKNHVEL